MLVVRICTPYMLHAKTCMYVLLTCHRMEHMYMNVFKQLSPHTELLSWKVQWHLRPWYVPSPRTPPTLTLRCHAHLLQALRPPLAHLVCVSATEVFRYNPWFPQCYAGSARPISAPRLEPRTSSPGGFSEGPPPMRNGHPMMNTSLPSNARYANCKGGLTRFHTSFIFRSGPMPRPQSRGSSYEGHRMNVSADDMRRCVYMVISLLEMFISHSLSCT